MAGTHDARERIVAAAQELFYSNGIAATGVDAVAERAGVGKMSLYRHFAGKDDLIEAALRARNLAHLDWLMPIEARPGRERVLAVFDRIARSADRPGFHGCPFMRVAVELPDGHRALDAVREHKRGQRERMGAAARDLGAADPQRLARQLALLIDGAAAACVVQASGQPARDARELAELAMDAAGGGRR